MRSLPRESLPSFGDERLSILWLRFAELRRLSHVLCEVLLYRVAAQLDLVDEKLKAISGRLERMETILDGKDKKGGLMARVGRHQD